jgi:hypothetical protein
MIGHLYTLLLNRSESTAPPPPAPPPLSIGGGGLPLYLYRTNPAEPVRPRKSRRRRLNEALIVSRLV